MMVAFGEQQAIDGDRMACPFIDVVPYDDCLATHRVSRQIDDDLMPDLDS
jgi:hypothetical protein